MVLITDLFKDLPAPPEAYPEDAADRIARIVDPCLMLKSGNWHTWAIGVRLHLRKYRVLAVINHAGAPGALVDAVIGFIGTHVAPELRHIAANAASVSECLIALANITAPFVGASPHMLRKAIQNITQGPAESIAAYLDRARKEMSAYMSSGGMIEEATVVDSVLAGLRSDFAESRLYLERRARELHAPCTFASISEELCRAEKAQAPAAEPALMAVPQEDVQHAEAFMAVRREQGREHLGDNAPLRNRGFAPRAQGAAFAGSQTNRHGEAAFMQLGNALTQVLQAIQPQRSRGGASRGRGRGFSRGRGRGRAGSMLCHRCKQFGHQASDCLAPAPVREQHNAFLSSEYGTYDEEEVEVPEEEEAY